MTEQHKTAEPLADNRYRITIVRTTPGSPVESLVDLEGWIPLDSLLADAEDKLIITGLMEASLDLWRRIRE